MSNNPPARFWIWIYFSTGLVLMIATGVFLWLASESRKEAGLGRTANAKPVAGARISAERYQLLARFDPPPYTQAEAAGANPEFRAAMEHYATHDCAGAIAGLRQVLAARHDFSAARFYLGICSLVSRDSASGIAELRAVIASGESPYLDAARFYMAKGLLGEGDIAGARQQLASVISRQGELAPQAQALLAAIQ